MSRFHSNVSRREFMKGLGLGAVGLGAAAAAAPVFHDVDEVMSSPNSQLCHPWWVSAVDKPTVEIDWSTLGSWDMGYEDLDNRYGRLEARERRAATSERRSAEKAAGLAAGTPGFALRDEALKTGCSTSLVSPDPGPSWIGHTVKTPAERGVARYSGTPEENARTVRAALHMYGSPTMGFLEMDANIKKLITPTDRYRYEDVDQAYQDGRVYVIPNKCKWIIVSSVMKSEDMARHMPQGGRPYGYNLRSILRYRTQKFVKSLGYQCLQRGLNVPLGVMAGNNELGRIAHSVHPLWGARMVINNVFITDLPLEPTKPIDAGIFKFCYQCKKCGTVCQEKASASLNMDTEPNWDPSGPWNRQGVKCWSINWPSCGFCEYCSGVCVFNHKAAAAVHTVTRAVLAKTTIFNSFFANMDDIFYPKQFEGMEEWWNRDLRTYPYDVILGGDNRR